MIGDSFIESLLSQLAVFGNLRRTMAQSRFTDTLYYYMGGFLIIDDGRAVAPNNWGYDRMVEAIAGSLPASDAAAEFKDWLLKQRSCIRGPGLGSVDVRELTPANQNLFWGAVTDAVRRCEAEGGEDWDDPSFFSTWMDMFSNLLALRESYLRGDGPDTFNPYVRSVISPTNSKSGPGW